MPFTRPLDRPIAARPVAPDGIQREMEEKARQRAEKGAGK